MPLIKRIPKGSPLTYIEGDANLDYLEALATATNTVETLTNKTINLTSNTLSGTLAQFNTACSDADFASLAGTETLTNKTLTAPVITTPTGIVKGDVGLGNVDNTSDATKDGAVATLTNKTLVAAVLGSSTATTQTVGDNSTKLATTAYADRVGAPASVTSKIQPITASVAANALTITLNPTTLDFRSATIGSGTVSSVSVGTAISLTVPSTATLGTVSAQQSRLAVLAINNAGTAELAVVNIAGGADLTETGVISTTALSAASTSSSVIYSTTARSSLAYRVVGYVESTQATAGTWATAPSTIQGYGGQSAGNLTVRNALNVSGLAPMYACRAFVNFNGTGTVAIRSSGNVSSITDNGVGDYTVNFTTAMPDANYAATGTCKESATSLAASSVLAPGIYAVGSLRIITVEAALAVRDMENMNVAIFR